MHDHRLKCLFRSGIKPYMFDLYIALALVRRKWKLKHSITDELAYTMWIYIDEMFKEKMLQTM